MPREDEFISGFRRLHHNFDELFAELLEGRPRGAGRRAAADVYVIDDPPALVIEIDAAGVDPDAVDIQLEGKLLTIRGERRRTPGKHRVYHHAEIDWGPFERRIQLGVAVSGELATARYESGLLVITLPLTQSQSQRRVPISLQGAE
jgi:HSP20 family protein